MTESSFASAGLVCAFFATLVSVLAWVAGGRTRSSALFPTFSALLWVAVAFSQDVVAFWLASLAYVASSVALWVMRVLMRRLAVRGPSGDVMSVAVATLRVVAVTALCDLVVLCGLSLVERVIPFYSAYL